MLREKKEKINILMKIEKENWTTQEKNLKFVVAFLIIYFFPSLLRF